MYLINFLENIPFPPCNLERFFFLFLSIAYLAGSVIMTRNVLNPPVGKLKGNPEQWNGI